MKIRSLLYLKRRIGSDAVCSTIVKLDRHGQHNRIRPNHPVKNPSRVVAFQTALRCKAAPAAAAGLNVGSNTICIAAADPAVVLEKLVLTKENTTCPRTWLGPAESYRTERPQPLQDSMCFSIRNCRSTTFPFSCAPRAKRE